MDWEKKIVTKAIHYYEERNLSSTFSKKELFRKDIEKSNQARQSGNQWFAKKNHGEKEHEEIWKLYTKSIAFAPTGSEELATGFSNRSVFLLHLKKYKDALSDIERALKNKNSSALKVKLFCRQAECFVALQDGKQSNSLEKARYWLNRVDNGCEKLKLTKMIERVDQVIKDNVPGDLQDYKKNDLTCKNDGVAIINDEKLGKGLMATKDFEPGEPVYIEEFYVTSVNKTKMHAYCSHCLAISWALIPCDQCAYQMYCSEKCKTKAWQEYHDLECRLKHGFYADHFSTYYAELGVRSLIMGIKEAGSFEKLKSWINKMDNCENSQPGEFLNHNKSSSNRFKSFYSLKNSTIAEKIEVASTMVVPILYSFIEYTEIFENGVDKNHKDMLFLGCLLLRLMTKSVLNAFSVLPMNEGCKVTTNISKCLQSFCCARGMSISLMTSLINHSCDNNVNKIYTNDGKVVYYAVKPIKAKSQIFSSYYFDYAGFGKINRQLMLSCLFEFNCNCKACKQNWPTTELICQRDYHNYPAKYDALTLKIMNQNRPIMQKSLINKKHYSSKEIQALAKDIATLNKQKTEKPNIPIACFHSAFSNIMEKRYFDVLKIPKSCSNKKSIS